MRAVIAIALLAATGCAGHAADQQPIAITHVSVIDVAAGTTRLDQTVVVTGNRITYVGPAAGAKVPGDARVIDGRGKFLIPGLWDMDVHGFVFSDFAGALMIANGVTGARDMGYYIDTTLRWKTDIAAGREVGPRLVAGVRVDGPVNRARFVAHVLTAEDGARAVDTLSRKKDGSRRADFITPYLSVPRAAYFGVAREAKKLGVPFAGHVPHSVSVVEASDAGQHSIEHQDDLMRACTSPAQCRAVIAILARNQTWVTPTLVVYQPSVHGFDSATTHPEWAKYVSGIIQAGWMARAASVSRRDSMVVRKHVNFDRTRDLNRAGVKLLAGTGVPQAFVYPGFSLHEELALLVRSGLTTAEALRTATYNPAEYLGSLDSLGTVAQGKVADLVLLDADPLTDIRNTRRISFVIANGRLFDSAARAKLLNHVENVLKR